MIHKKYLNIDRLATLQAFLLKNLVGQLNVRVPVAKPWVVRLISMKIRSQDWLPGNVGHLGVVHVKQLVPLLVLQLHDVKHTLHTLEENNNCIPGDGKIKSNKHLFNAFVNEVLCEVGQLPQIAILAPHTLSKLSSEG